METSGQDEVMFRIRYLHVLIHVYRVKSSSDDPFVNSPPRKLLKGIKFSLMHTCARFFFANGGGGGQSISSSWMMYLFVSLVNPYQFFCNCKIS